MKIKKILYLMISLHEGSLAKLFPAALVVQCSGCFQSDLDVAALQGESKTGFFVLDEVQRNLWVALLLQVGDYALAYKSGIADHVKHLIKILCQPTSC
jgi:hypothetical protein